MSLSEPCLFFFGCNIYPVCYLRGEHIVCSKALMRINQMKGEREQGNLLPFGVFFLTAALGFFISFTIGAYSFREFKKTDCRKKKVKQNNTIRMLLDLFFFFFFSFFLLKYTHCRGEERVRFHRIPHEISRGSTRS